MTYRSLARFRKRSRSSARCDARPLLVQDDSVTRRRDARASDSTIQPGLRSATASELRKFSTVAAAKMIENSGSSPGRELRAVAHRDGFPSRCARALFVEDLDVAADALDTSVDEEIDFEGRRQARREGTSVTAPSSSAMSSAMARAPQAIEAAQNGTQPGRSALADGVA